VTANPRVHGEGTDASGSPPGSTSAPRRLLALTRDPQLCQALQDLGEAAPPLRLVDTLTALTDELMQQGAAIVLLDAAALDSPVEGVVDALNVQFPDLLLMVAGQGSEQTLLATRISEQAVFRFVHKPASQQRLRLFMDAAQRAAPRREASRGTAIPAAKPARAGVTALGGAPQPPRSGFNPTFAIGIAALTLAVITAWLLWPRHASPPPAAIVDPVQEQARAVEQSLRTAEAALLDGNLEEAAAAIDQARTLQPDSPRVAFLAAQLERERSRVAADAAQQQARDTSQAQLRAALARMNDRLDQGALLEPLDDSAAAHFRDARKIAPEDPAVLNARDTLVAAMLTAADKALATGKIADARQLVDVASRLHAKAPGLDLIRRRISEAAAAQAAAARPAAQQQHAPPPAPANDTAAAAASIGAALPPVAPPPPAAAPTEAAPAPQAAAGPSFVSAGTLKVVRRVEARYPTQAWEKQISGWVEMEFTVTADGTTRDIRVSASEPARIFDAVAVAALRRYRYEPVVRDGSPVELRARMRMRFTPQGKD
jgi:protein TonB